MRKEVTMEAPSVEEAIDAALEELGVQQDVVEYEILADPGKRRFGRAVESKAKVRVWIAEEFASEIEDGHHLAEDPLDDSEDEEPEVEEQGAGRKKAGLDDVQDEEDSTHGKPGERIGFERDHEPTEEELDQVADAGIAVIEGILADLGVEASVDEYEGDDGEIILDIVGPDLGILIGRHGKTLDALQTLVSTLARRRLGWHHPVLVDVEGYRSRRRGKLEQIAKNAADKAAKQEREVHLRPMNAFERKVIHLTLRDDRRVTTQSEGEEPDRAVVVTPR